MFVEKFTIYDKGRYKMLKSVFSINTKNKDSQYYVYGTNLYSQILYTNILMDGEIALNGYVLEYNKSEASQEFKNLYNQKLFILKDLCEFDASKITIISISLNNEEIAVIKSHGFNLIIPTLPEYAVIYGGGNNCLTTKELLETCGCTILAIADADPETVRLKNEERFGVKIISKEELKEQYISEHIVVSVLKNNPKKQIESWLIENNFTYHSCMANEYLYVNSYGKDYSFTYRRLATSFFKNNWLCFGTNRIFLYGSISWLSAIDYFIKICHLPIVAGYISEDGFTGQRNGIPFVSIYDLLTEDYGLYHVWVDNDINTILKAREQVIQLGLNPKQFSVSYDGQRLFRNIVTDSRLGFMNNKKGYVLIKKPHKEITLRIGILGDSTSDPCCYNIISWSENLLDILESNGIHAEIYNAAYIAYTIEDELLTLSRYLLPLNLDVIISYSGTNDMEKNHPYENFSAKNFFDNAMTTFGKEMNKNGIFLLSVKETLKSQNSQESDYCEEIFEHATHWVNVQQMMHAICAERNIRYIGVLQPTMLSKQPLTNTEIQWPFLEHKKLLRENVYRHMHMLWNELVETTSWAYDFTRIFDNNDEEIFRDICHVTENGNRIVAENIAKLILK